MTVPVMVYLLDPADFSQGWRHGLGPFSVTSLQNLHPLHVGADLDQVADGKVVAKGARWVTFEFGRAFDL